MTKLAQIKSALKDLKSYALIPIEKFDKIVARYGLDPGDDALVRALVRLDWQFNMVDGVYINGEDTPLNRWDHLLRQAPRRPRRRSRVSRVAGSASQRPSEEASNPVLGLGSRLRQA